MSSATKLSQHTATQSLTREARHAIPTCQVQPHYPGMQSPNHRPGRLDRLSQHAIETNHRFGNSDMLSLHTQCRQTIPACTEKFALYKRGCKSPEQQTS